MSLINKAITLINARVDNLIEKARKNEMQGKAITRNPDLPIEEASGYKDKPGLVNYKLLRRMAMKNSIVSAIIQTRCNQVALFSRPQEDRYGLGFKIEKKDKNTELTDADKKIIHELEQFILNTGVVDDYRNIDTRDTFEVFLRKIVRDRLIVDQVAAELIFTNKGLIHHFKAVSGGTIKFISKNKNDQSMVVYENDELRNKKIEEDDAYAQVWDGRVIQTFNEDELIFRMGNPVSDLDLNGYSVGELELLINTVTAHMQAENHNRLMFSNGTSTRGILHIKGDIHPSKLAAFRRNWQAQTSGNANAFRTPIIGGVDEVKWISLQPSNRDMEYNQWVTYLVRVITSIYQIDPLEIGFDISRGGSSEGGQSGSFRNAERVQLSKDKGLLPLLRFIEDLINDEILRRHSPDYEFKFVGLNAETAEKELERQTKEMTHFATINEIRKERGLEELTLEDIQDNPFNFIMNPTFLQIVNTIQMQQQQVEQEENMANEDELFNIEEFENDEDIDETKKSFTKAFKYYKIKI